MIIRDKIIHCARLRCFIVFSILLGCAGMAEAQVILSDSIRDILSTAQIDELKANATVKAIKLAKRDEKQEITSSGVYRNMGNAIDGQSDFIDYVWRNIGNGWGGNMGIATIFNIHTKIANQKERLSIPNDPDGLAIRFAPSDEELGVQ